MERHQKSPPNSGDPCSLRPLTRILLRSFRLRSPARGEPSSDVPGTSLGLRERLFERMKKLDTHSPDDSEAFAVSLTAMLAPSIALP